MSIIEVNTQEIFDKTIQASTITVVHFSADWAAQCGQVTEVLKELSKLPDVQANGIQFCLCDAEKFSEISLKYKVDSVPTVIFFKKGTQVDRIDGADSSEITAKVKKYTNDKIGSETITPQPSLEERLKLLTNKHKVMVFMKGTRDTPRCGFSRTLIQILNGTGVEYDTFDILTDEAVRQGLKEYSEWPTYPQVYVNGELIGGLDIIKELQSSGELDSTLNP